MQPHLMTGSFHSAFSKLSYTVSCLVIKEGAQSPTQMLDWMPLTSYRGVHAHMHSIALSETPTSC